MFCRDLDCCITLKVTLDKQWTAWSWVFQGRSDRKGGDRLGRSGGTGHDHPVFQRLCRDQNLWFELQGSGCFSGTGQERFLFGSELVGRVLQNRYEEKSWGRKVSMTGGVVSNLERHKCHMGYHYVLIRIDILRCTSHLDTKWWKPTWKSIAFFFFCVCVWQNFSVTNIRPWRPGYWYLFGSLNTWTGAVMIHQSPSGSLHSWCLAEAGGHGRWEIWEMETSVFFLLKNGWDFGSSFCAFHPHVFHCQMAPLGISWCVWTSCFWRVESTVHSLPWWLLQDGQMV